MVRDMQCVAKTLNIYHITVCDASIAFGYADNIQCKDAFNKIISMQRGAVVELDKTLKDAIQALWQDDAIIQTLQRRSEFQVKPSCLISTHPPYIYSKSTLMPSVSHYCCPQ